MPRRRGNGPQRGSSTVQIAEWQRALGQERAGKLPPQGLELGPATTQAQQREIGGGELRIERLLLTGGLVERAGNLAVEHGVSFTPDAAPGLVMLSGNGAKLYVDAQLPGLRQLTPEPGKYAASGPGVFGQKWALPDAAKTPVRLSALELHKASRRVVAPVALAGTVAAPEMTHFRVASANWGVAPAPAELRIGRLGPAESPTARPAFHAAWQEMLTQEGPLEVGALQVVAFVPGASEAPPASR